jgi:hypothetical protein
MDERRGQDLWRRLDGPEHDQLRTVCVMVQYHVAVDAVAMSTSGRGWVTTVATDEWATRLEEYQHTLGEGPTTDVERSGLAVLTPDLRTTWRHWPVFTERATASSLAAVFAVPIPDTHGNPIGTLTLYRRTPGPLSTAELRHLAVMADFAATLIDARRDAVEPAATHLDVATGLIAARHAVSREDALVLLRAHAYVQDRPLHAIAEAILGEDPDHPSPDDGR